MKKLLKQKNGLAMPQDEPDIADLINKLQQQLNAMERKLDTLINQSPKKSFEKSTGSSCLSRFKLQAG